MLFGRSIIVCREGWYYLLVLGFVVTGSFLREVNLLLVLAGMMFFPFLLNLRTVIISSRGLTVRRRIPDVVSAGETFHIDLALSKLPSRFWLGGGASWVIHAQDKIQPLAKKPEITVPPRLTFWRLAPGQREDQSYRCCLADRGRYELGPVTLSSGFPLGLVRAERRVKSADHLIVLPRLGQLTNAWRRLYQEVHQGSRANHHKHGVSQGEFHSLRDWRPGDSRRRIHWRTTARRGAPVVRQYEQNREQNLVLLIDAWLPDGVDPVTFEKVVSFASTVVTDICQRGGSHLYLGLATERPTVGGGPSSTGLMRELLESLAVLAPASVNHLAPLLTVVRETVPPAMTTVILSPRALDLAVLEREIHRQNDNGRSRFGRIVTISGDQEIGEYFQPDVPSAARSVRRQTEPQMSA
ncbi:MAG: DUF58 domain-containing protein [Pirellulales bacterium]